MSLGHRFGHMAFSPPHSGPHCYPSTFARLFCCKCVARALGFHNIEVLSAGQTAIGLDLPFILVSGAISEETAVEAMKAEREVQIVEKLSQASDHPILVTLPESEYLKGFVCRVI